MTLANTVDYAEQVFEQTYPEKTIRARIMLTFLQEELGITPEELMHLFEEGVAESQSLDMEADRRTRFFLWLFVNHLSTLKYSHQLN